MQNHCELVRIYNLQEKNNWYILTDQTVTVVQFQNPISSHYSHFVTRLIFSSPLSILSPPPCSSLTCSDSLIGAQLTGFLLGEQEPCGPSASSRRMNRCPAPRRLPAPYPCLLNAPRHRAARCCCCLNWLNLGSFIWPVWRIYLKQKRKHMEMPPKLQSSQFKSFCLPDAPLFLKYF